MKFFRSYLESKFKKQDAEDGLESSDVTIETAKERPKSAKELVEGFEQKEHLPMGEIIQFEGVDQKDVYNITAPFESGGRTYIAGRVESRDSEYDSQACFFEEKNGAWILSPEMPVFNLQDPFTTKINQELIFGGVETFPCTDTSHFKSLGYRTIFFRGKTLQTLTHFATGPNMMKDIRMLELSNNEILVLTRPQNPQVSQGGPGKIGITTISRLEDLTETNILNAKIIEDQFLDKEWGGADEIYLLENGKIGVLGHIAYEELLPNNTRKKHYYAMTFTLELKTNTVSPIHIIASRKNFPAGPAKYSPELEDVIFPGGLVHNKNGTATLYAGLSDAQAGRLTIPDPWQIP